MSALFGRLFRGLARSRSQLMLRTGRRLLYSFPRTMPDISLDSFAHRQFDDPHYGGTKIKLPKEQFMKRVLAYYEERNAMQDEYKDRPVLVDGYAPFCKHIFMPNFDDSIRDGAMPITAENEQLLKTSYEARNERELPVLVRYFPGDKVESPVSKYLDLICTLRHHSSCIQAVKSDLACIPTVYSREQIQKENEAMGKADALDDAPWRLISIKGQAEPFEIPMNPITMMRNELISQGGSGVPIDREAYMKSVRYWKTHGAIH